MNTDSQHNLHLLETDHNDIPTGEWFVCLAIAMIAVAAIYLAVALLTPVVSWSPIASAAAAALTDALC